MTTKVPVPTGGSSEKVTPTTDMEDIPVSSATLYHFVFGLIFIALVAGLFVWLGGLQFVRRILPGSSQARYRKVEDEDVEK